MNKLKPVLYDSSETNFVGNGIGPLSDSYSCIVREERNGAFELELEYPITGIHYGDIQNRNIIFTKPNPHDNPQPFRIYRITKPINGIVTVYAEHISYDLSGVSVSPFTASTLSQAVSGLLSHALPNNQPFVLTTDMESGAGFSVSVPASFRSLMGGSEGSLIDIYGGEYYYDKFSIQLKGNRGLDNGFRIVYGINMTSVEQEENCSAVYSHIYPYWANENTVVEVNNGQYGKLVPTTTPLLPYTRILPVDLSSEFDEQPTPQALLTTAQYYAQKAKLGQPKVSLKVEFEKLNTTDDVKLCDTVTVVFPKLGVNSKAKVVSTEYDALLDKYISLEIGSTTKSIVDTISGQQIQIQNIPSSINIQEAIVKATAWITGSVDAGKVVFVRNQNGDPTAIKIVSTTKPAGSEFYPMWIISAGGIGYSTDGGQTISNIALTADGHIVADTINLNTANISGQLSATNIDASNLRVQWANIDNIDTSNLRVKWANIDDVEIKNAQIDTLYANKIVGGDTGGYISPSAISSSNHPLSSLNASLLSVNTLGATNINGVQTLSFQVNGTTIGGGSVKYGDRTVTWDKILDAAEASGAPAKWG